MGKNSLDFNVINAKISKSKGQILFCGGHGGHVVYDGAGGAMRKDGGPIDRVFLLGNSCAINKNAALEISYGAMRFCTGPLSKPVESHENDKGDIITIYKFSKNDDDEAEKITGCIPELNIPIGTTLFKGSVENSIMESREYKAEPNLVSLPYTAVHLSFSVHPALLRHFGVKSLENIAVSGWDKSGTGILGDQDKMGRKINTEQHLAYLRVFF